MTILESLTAIAKARPDLVQNEDGWYLPRGADMLHRTENLSRSHRANLLLWAFETATRERITLNLHVGTTYEGCAWTRSVMETHESEDPECPTTAALAALAAALTTTEEEST